MYRMLKSSAEAFSAHKHINPKCTRGLGPGILCSRDAMGKKTDSVGNGQARWREAGSPSRRRRLEGNVRNNETTASGQDVGEGDAAGRTPARPGEHEGGADFEDEDDAALGQEKRGKTHPSTDEIIYNIYI